jgi:hypothetical protein
VVMFVLQSTLSALDLSYLVYFFIFASYDLYPGGPP